MVALSVVIPATDARPTLARAVAAAERALAEVDELIVVDGPAGLGPAAARNLGSQRATCDVVVFVDSDVEVHADAFALIRAAFDRDGGLTAVFGAYDDDPGAPGLVSDFRNLLHHHVHHEGAGPAETFWAGLGAIRRDALLGAGGFDEVRFPNASIEDVELGMRITRAGGRILLDPRIQGKHLKRWTLSGMTQTDLLRRGVPWVGMLLEDREHSAALNLGWRHRVGAGASVLLVVSIARRAFRPAALLLALLVALDRRFYARLYRLRGGRAVAAGIPLHVVHRLTSAAAVPLALGTHLVRRLSRPPDR